MCLGIPGLVVEVPDKQWAVVDLGGIRRRVGIQLVNEVKPGDYMMIHAGFAVEILDLAEAEARIRLWEEFLHFESAGKV